MLLALAVSGAASAQSNDKNPKSKEEQEKEMAAWTAYMTPGTPHKHLESAVGTWDADVTMWMAPGAEPMKTKGTMETTMILGGRYQQSVHKMDWNGMPFEGVSVVGYDNALKKYQSTWVDNFGTGVMMMEGTHNESTKTTAMKGKMTDPMTGKDLMMREEVKIVDNDHHVMDMYCNDKGKEYKTMHIEFTRRK